ncbi:MAG: hypothetical protein IBJ17_01775, partial [Reyranella sp.]|nr:hypothetical protein [Reyranella sp.]
MGAPPAYAARTLARRAGEESRHVIAETDRRRAVVTIATVGTRRALRSMGVTVRPFGPSLARRPSFGAGLTVRALGALLGLRPRRALLRGFPRGAGFTLRAGLAFGTRLTLGPGLARRTLATLAATVPATAAGATAATTSTATALRCLEPGGF